MENIKVLVVEDDPASAVILEKILFKADYEVVSVESTGQDAINAIEEHDPDIVLMDISISGGMDGVETAIQIKAIKELPIIYLTGYSDEETLERAQKTTPFAYILKPFREKEVTITIRMAMYKSQVDLQIKASENRLATTLGSLHDAVISTDAEACITYLNPTAELITGTPKERAEGLPVESVLELRDRNTLEPIENKRHFLLARDKAAERNDPLCLISASGQEHVVQITTTPTLDADDEINGFVVVLCDITEQYNAERNKRLMAAALESLEDAVIITNAPHSREGEGIVSVNKAFEKITGYSPSEVIGKKVELLNGERTDKTMSEQVAKTLKNGNVSAGETHQYRKDGHEFIAQWSVAPVFEETDEIAQLVYVLRDITQLRQLEENIRQSQKIEAIGRLAGGIAHDFNNLLSVINSYSELLSLKIEKDSPFLKYVQNIRTAGQRGASLVSQLMTFSRRDSATPVIIDLGEIILETQKMLRPITRENIELVAEADSKVLPVKADPGQIEQIVVNLCVNACDAMPDGGSLQIAARNVEIKDKTESRQGGEYMIPGQYVRVTVQDDGTGIEESVIKKIFEPFFTTKDVGKGTGLGLSTVYGIVKQSGGYIDVSSEIGEGSCFTIHFPAVIDETSVSSKVDEDTPKAVQRGSETILLVEDDETFADCITGLLSLHGYIVHTCSDGSDAIDRFIDKASDIKVLIADIVLPKVSGREVATRFLEVNPDLKVVFMTGYDDELDNFYNFPSESTIMQKPFSLNSILSKVRDLLDCQEETVEK